MYPILGTVELTIFLAIHEFVKIIKNINLALKFFFSVDVSPEWLSDYPVTIIQFLFFLYHNFTDFMQLFMSADVLGALAGTLFPKPTSPSVDSSGASTPADEVNKSMFISLFKKSNKSVILNYVKIRFI